MKRELVALGLTLSVLVSLLAFAQPTAAVLTTVDGPDEVRKPDPIVFDTSVEIRENERVPVESFNLVIETDEGESVTVTFAPNGTVQSIAPASGVVGEGEIRVQLLRQGLEITPLDSDVNFGYGYRSGTNERTGESRSFGYGYGYGGEQTSFRFRVSMDSKAFKQGQYTVQLSVNTDGGEAAFASNEEPLEVLVPSGIQPGDRGGGQADTTADDDDGPAGAQAAEDDGAEQADDDGVEDEEGDDESEDEGDEGDDDDRRRGPPDHAGNGESDVDNGAANRDALVPFPAPLR